jgi:hypothetical protein
MTFFKPYFSEWLVERYFAGRWVLYLAVIGGIWWWLS